MSETNYCTSLEVHNKQLNEVYVTWKDTDLFKKYFDSIPENRAKKIALILDNQKRMNEASISKYEKFNNLSLELTAKIFSEFLPFYMVGVEPMFGPTGLVYFSFDKDVRMSEIVARTRFLKTRFNYDGNEEDGLELLARVIREEITREIIKDLSNNISTVDKMDLKELNCDTLLLKLFEISGHVLNKTLKNGANWLVVGPNIAKIIGSACGLDVSDLSRIKYLGDVNSRWRLILDPEFPENEILCGLQEDLLDGYFYCPYVFLTSIEAPPPVHEGFVSHSGLLSRYGKKLTSSAPYAKIVIQTTAPNEDKPSFPCL